ncbi:hypothetical protein JCM17823_14860 [Halorubrum gandharaense]
MNRSNPFDEIEQFFGRTPFAGDRTWGVGDRTWGRDFRGADVDVADYDDEFVVVVDLLGYERDDIEVRARDGVLTIAATREHEHEASDGEGVGESDGDRRYLRRERRHESVARTINLPRPSSRRRRPRRTTTACST